MKIRRTGNSPAPVALRHSELVTSAVERQIAPTSMPSNLSTLEFALDDMIAGQRLTPETVDLPTLRGFLAEVEKLIKGDVPGASLCDSRIRIEDGSVRILTMVAHLLASDVRADFARLAETDDLDQMQPSRAKVIEAWQARAHATPSRSYVFRPEVGAAPLRVANESQFQHGGENAWVSVEKYLTGQVVDAGGKQDPNVHLVLSDSGETVKVDATKAQLAAEKENLLYKFVSLRVQAEQHLRTHELRDIRLIQFLPHESETDERALANLWQKGRDAWRDVRSATGWVEAMSGNSLRTVERLADELDLADRLHLWPDKSLGNVGVANRMLRPKEHMSWLRQWWGRISEWPELPRS